MTNKEKSKLFEMISDLSGVDASDGWARGWNEAIETVLNEIAKINWDVAKKPIYKEDPYVSERYYFCAHCGVRLPMSYNRIDQMIYPYCPYCGGKQDWSDENE